MSEKKYVGITIGPIFETMNLVSSPSALWASSYIFSFISKSICCELVDNYEVKNIVTPYFSKDDESYKRNDGVGLFHDRIVFEKPGNFDIADLEKIRKSIIENVAKKFHINNIDFLDEYIMISGAEFIAENPILDSSLILDSLELSKRFVAAEESNPILGTFTSSDDPLASTRNDEIKKIVKESLQIEGWQLFNKNELGIKELGNIAFCNKEDKKYNEYCAIVRADGDRIGEIIKRLGGQEAAPSFSDFSKTCFTYCSEAAELVKKYNGITVYSGGDDLLAILPSMSETGTLFDFAKELKDLFNEVFERFINICGDIKPTLSMGIFIFYKKFPLYEALSDSVSLLFGTAKKTRNCLAINLRKHSGQSLELVVSNDVLESVIKLQNAILYPEKNNKADDEKTNDIIVSALQKISLFSNLFEIAKSDAQIVNLFENVFDASSHEGSDFLHKALPERYNELRNKKNAVRTTDEKEKFSDAFSALMKIFKFYLEKKGEK